MCQDSTCRVIETTIRLSHRQLQRLGRLLTRPSRLLLEFFDCSLFAHEHSLVRGEDVANTPPYPLGNTTEGPLRKLCCLLGLGGFSSTCLNNRPSYGPMKCSAIVVMQQLLTSSLQKKAFFTKARPRSARFPGGSTPASRFLENDSFLRNGDNTGTCGRRFSLKNGVHTVGYRRSLDLWLSCKCNGWVWVESLVWTEVLIHIFNAQLLVMH